MRRMVLATAAVLLLTLPAACMCPGRRGEPAGQGCQKHQGCDCKCRQQSDCPKHQQQEPPAPAK